MRALLPFALLILALPVRAQFPIPVVSDGTSHEVVGLAHASDGGLYAVGTFGGALALEPDWPLATVEWEAPNGTGFLARFDGDGVLQWAHVLEARRAGFGDASSAFPKRIAVLDDGGVVLLGTITPGVLIDLDPGAGEAIVQPQTGNPLAFVVRYGASGEYVWHQAVPTTGAFSTAHRMGLATEGDAVYVLLPPSPDADPGAPEAQYFAPSLLALDAADGSTRFTAETTSPTSATAEGVAVGGGAVYTLTHHGSLANQRFTVERHDATSGAALWSYTPTAGRDRPAAMEADASGALYVEGELTSSATGVALDPSAPGTISHSRSGNERAFLGSYSASGALRWSAPAEVNVGAFGSGFALGSDALFVAGFGTLKSYATADGSLVQTLAAVHGTPSLYSVATTASRVSVYAQPRNDGLFAFEGLPEGSPATAIVQLDQSTLSRSTSPTAAAPPASGAALTLGAARPHPVARGSEVEVTLASGGHVRLRLFDLLGREAAVFADAEMASGVHRVRLDARGLASGTYVLVLESGGERRARTVVLSR
ncbi:hypothetical protein [Rubricoccus marinus]|uniref:Secretion system C-terminal sorting domain-containing protein n=1 Tax=Rubricoccus marinus TaxID=716817 RepID=A0A259TVT2_9BACT|nr:hypothetical protein [Rubricoccus marinus]OZC01737.1 hypothetical protein BSZ36_01295 [Rubricoccus marinus]